MHNGYALIVNNHKFDVPGSDHTGSEIDVQHIKAFCNSQAMQRTSQQMKWNHSSAMFLKMIFVIMMGFYVSCQAMEKKTSCAAWMGGK